VKARSWWVAAIAVATAAGAFASVGAVMIVAGVYNVAASVEHLYVTDRLIEFALHRSISVRSASIEAPSLEDDDLARLGAEHFSSGCAPCHGDPDRQQNPIVERMYPAPPQLRHAVSNWTSEELFWIVKHGIKFTGMPAWPSEGRDDEVWAVVAYLGRLEASSADDSRHLGERKQASGDFPLAELGDADVESCARCHGGEGSPPISDRVPVLNGQNAHYLSRALREYRDGTRASGIMAPIAAGLAPDEVDDLARYYSSLASTTSEAGGAAGGDVQFGREIAERGIPADGIPPCLTCHSGQASAAFPALAGLSANYLKGQLDLWRRGLRDRTTYGAIMAPIARRLTPEQIDAVTAYLSILTRSGGSDGIAKRGPIGDG
jgi:cytochrome c553